jgi:phosphotransferase system IIA component
MCSGDGQAVYPASTDHVICTEDGPTVTYLFDDMHAFHLGTN